MQNLKFSIFINAPREKVWNAMLGDATYREWTKPFNETSYFEGDWSEGSKMLFLGEDKDGKVLGGMYSRIAKNIPFEYVSIEHLGEVHDGVEKPWPGNEDVQDNVSYVWTGVVNFWDRYLAGPADYIWNDVFVDLIWESFIVNMQALRNGESATNFDMQGDLPYQSIPQYIDGYTPYQPVN